jgi:hypothetical protein
MRIHIRNPLSNRYRKVCLKIRNQLFILYSVQRRSRRRLLSKIEILPYFLQQKNQEKDLICNTSHYSMS